MFKKYFKVKVCLVIAIILFASNLFANTTYSYSKEIKKIPPKSVSLNTKQVTIPINGVISLESRLEPADSADTVNWYTSNKKIATINKGLVIGVSEGTAIVTVRTSSGKRDMCRITVTKPWSEDELIKLIKVNSINEGVITDIIDTKLSNETNKRMLSSNVIEDKEPDNYYSSTYYTLNQNEFNTMYDNMFTEPLDTSTIPCYPSEEFDWLATEISAVTGSAINVHISDLNATITSNDFHTISQSQDKYKVYTKYTVNVILTGYIEQDFPILPDETVYLSVNAMSNNIEVNGTSGGTPLNSDGSFFMQLTFCTNSLIDYISFRQASIYGYPYGY